MKKIALTLALLALLGPATALAQSVNLANSGDKNYVRQFENLKKEYYSMRISPTYDAVYQELEKLTPKFQKQVTPEELAEIVAELSNIKKRRWTGSEFDEFFKDLEAFSKSIEPAKEKQSENSSSLRAQERRVDDTNAGPFFRTSSMIALVVVSSLLLFLLFRLRRKKAPKQPLQKTVSKTTPQSAAVWDQSLVDFMKKSQGFAFGQPGGEQQRIQDLEEENQRLIKEVETKNARIARLENELEQAVADTASAEQKGKKDKQKLQKEMADLQARLARQNNELERAKAAFQKTMTALPVLEKAPGLKAKTVKNDGIATVRQKTAEVGETVLSQSPAFFQAHPDRDGTFGKWGESDSFKPYVSMYKFQVSDREGKLAEFEFVSDPSVLMDALSYPDVYLLPVCEILNPMKHAGNILTATKGLAVFAEGRWKVTKKARLLFEA